MPRYVLEILSFIEGVEAKRRADGKYHHIGYATERDPNTGDMRVLRFPTKARAAAYYDRMFGFSTSHGMRALNARGNWCSDWHPVTRHAYCVRDDVGVGASFFEYDDDESMTTRTRTVSRRQSQCDSSRVH